MPIDWLGFRFPAFERVIVPKRLKLVVNGEIRWANLRSNMITHAELMSQLRQQGIDDPAKVREASLEGDGRISVIAAEEAAPRSSDDRIKGAR